jgi:hypothetical protein
MLHIQERKQIIWNVLDQDPSPFPLRNQPGARLRASLAQFSEYVPYVKDETYVKRGSHRSTENRGFSPVLRFPLSGNVDRSVGISPKPTLPS